MNPNGVRKPEQIKLIMECRKSGLSDYQWCQKQGINPGTFYNWVSKLRKAGYAIPDSAGKVSGVPVIQEVVKLDLAESGISTPAMMEQNTSLPALYDGHGFLIVLAMFGIVERAVQIEDRAVWPVQFISHLHFRIDYGVVIQQDINIKAKFLIFNRLSRYNRIGNFRTWEADTGT